MSAAAGAGWLLAAVPASAGLFDDETARKQLTDQNQRIVEIRQQQDALTARIARMEEAAKVGRAPLFELMSQIEQLRQEITGLRGQIEVLGHNIDSTAKRQRDMYVDLDTRLRRLEESPPAPAGSAAPGGENATAPALGAAPSPAAAPANEVRAYDAAQSQRRSGNYQAAIAAFQGFIAQYPKSPLAHRAQYWIGDSYYNLHDFKSAIASQQKLVTTYPDSASVPDAMLNIASSQMELADTGAAKKTMDDLIARYPKSPAAEKAKRRLANLH
jgi:tol-pal system protein YbgF